MKRRIKNDKRYEARKQNNIFNNDIRKYLAEVITNADDSYNRLEQNGIIDTNMVCPIYIKITKARKSSRKVVVIDNAEGMDDQQLADNFGEYGADTSGGSSGKEVRGLYGQGATDVLMHASMCEKSAIIRSFKDGGFYTCKFQWSDGHKTIKVKGSKKSMTHLRGLREFYKIPKNGTIVEFGLPDKVTLPRNLVELISDFYMLRFIFKKPNRKIILTEVDSNKNQKDTQLSYEFPSCANQTNLIHKTLEISYENHKIHGELDIEMIEDKKGQDLNILIHDNHEGVYDNTLFNYENHPNANNIHGYLRLKGLSQVIREKLNQEQPEEILTDTRDGFNKRHDFYKTLAKQVEPIIETVLLKLGEEKQEKPIELSKKKEWKEALKALNKYFEEELEEEIGGINTGTKPPSDGLRFLNPSISITAGKKYSTKLLINTRLIPMGGEIIIDNKSKGINAAPSTILLTEEDAEQDDLIVKSISVSSNIVGAQGSVIATSGKYKSILFIKVIDENIHYPKYGLEFWPLSLTAKPDTKNSGKLFIDTKKFPINSKVVLNFDSVYIEPYSLDFVILEEHLVFENIARIDVPFKSKKIIGKTTLKAGVSGSAAELNINIAKSTDSNNQAGTGGFFSGVRVLKEESMFWQTFYNKRDGYITINSKNNINELHLGVDPDISKCTKDQRKYLAELCATEAAKQLIKIRSHGGKIEHNNYEAVLDEIQKEKNNLLTITVDALSSFIK